MLRDSIRIYGLIVGFIAIIFGLFYWYRVSFTSSADVLHLNEVVLTQAVSEVDNTSRFYEGALLLAPSFEPSVWERIEDQYPKESVVLFEYIFDTDDPRFEDVPEGDVSPEYIIGDKTKKPDVNDMAHMSGLPIKYARVNVRVPDHRASDSERWTYSGTITVDAASKSE